ncbi:MAG: FtsX-like permease family protein, partial [Oscillospiraceae bacterium]
DFKLVSTLGITDEDVEAISKIEGISQVYPSHQVDAIIEKSESVNGEMSPDTIVRLHSIDKKNAEKPINDLVLKNGRMPENPNECVVLEGNSVGSNYENGDKIRVDLAQDPNVKDDLTHTEFTVVGHVNSPLYMAIEKTTTKKGSGSVSNYAFVPDNSFKMEAYSELYLTIAQSKNTFCFDDDYKKMIDDFKIKLEKIGIERCEIRKNDVIGEANETLNKNKTEYNEKKSETNKKLADAQIELNNGNAEIKKGEAEIAKSKIDLANATQKIELGESELAKNQAEFTKKITAGEAEIANAKNKFAVEEQALTAKEAFLNSPECTLSQADIKKAKSEIEIGKIKIKTAKSALSGKENELATQKINGQNKINIAKKEIEKGKIEITNGTQKMTTGEKELATSKIKFQDAQKEFNKQKAEADLKLGDAEQKIIDAEKKINDIATPDWYALPREMSYGYAGFSQDADRIDAIAVVFPVFFFLVAALVCLTTMTRMVEEERTQIGILKALGYNKNIITAKYIVYAAVTSLVGSIIGLLIGFQIFPRVIWAAYGIMYTTPPIITPFNWKFALIATISFMIVTIGATFMACASELSSVPANLIRPKPPKSGKRVFLERITFIWKHLSFTKKLTARNILRYKKRFFMTVIGIAGCTALMLTGFGLKDSINGIVKNQFENLFHYDMQATFANPINLEKITDKQSEAIKTLETDERITNSMLINQENLTALSGNSSKRMETYLVVPKDIEKVQDFITFRTRKKHKPLEFPTEGAMISEKLSNELKLKIGDEILLENSDNKQFKVKVAGICEN